MLVGDLVKMLLALDQEAEIKIFRSLAEIEEGYSDGWDENPRPYITHDESFNPLTLFEPEGISVEQVEGYGPPKEIKSICWSNSRGNYTETRLVPTEGPVLVLK